MYDRGQDKHRYHPLNLQTLKQSNHLWQVLTDLAA